LDVDDTRYSKHPQKTQKPSKTPTTSKNISAQDFWMSMAHDTPNTSKQKPKKPSKRTKTSKHLSAQDCWMSMAPDTPKTSKTQKQPPKTYAPKTFGCRRHPILQTPPKKPKTFKNTNNLQKHIRPRLLDVDGTRYSKNLQKTQTPPKTPATSKNISAQDFWMSMAPDTPKTSKKPKNLQKHKQPPKTYPSKTCGCRWHPILQKPKKKIKNSKNLYPQDFWMSMAPDTPKNLQKH
jgi:hypothetical protein